MEDILWTLFYSVLPVGELRAGIPYALSHDVNPVLAYALGCGANILVFPITYVFLVNLHPVLNRWSFYAKTFTFFEKRVQKKLEKSVGKYGFWALMIFVMIPLPITGAYSGTLAAWAFKLPKGKAFLAVSLGVLIAGVIVSLGFFFAKNILIDWKILSVHE
jgi:uncharacterized membrane protein